MSRFQSADNDPNSPLTCKNQNTSAVLYRQVYSPELFSLFSFRLIFKFFFLFVSGTLQLQICLWKGSEQVKMSLVWFAGMFSLQLMWSSSPLKATKTVLSRSIPVRGHNTRTTQPCDLFEKMVTFLFNLNVGRLQIGHFKR